MARMNSSLGGSVIQGYFAGGWPTVFQSDFPATNATGVKTMAPMPFAVARGAPKATVQRSAIVPPPIRFPGRSVAAPVQPKPVTPLLGKATLPFTVPLREQVLQSKRLPSAALRPNAVQLSGTGHAFQVPATLSLAGSDPGQPLPKVVQQRMESFFNTSFADVRIHVGAQAASIGALAFTHGSNLHFAPGQYNPYTSKGLQLLGHELTHVVQQRAGRVRNPFGSGIAVVQDRAMEAEAERMGLRAASHQIPAATTTAHNTFQRKTNAQFSALLQAAGIRASRPFSRASAPPPKQLGHRLGTAVPVIQRMELTKGVSSVSNQSQFSKGPNEGGSVKTAGGTWTAVEYNWKMNETDCGLHIKLQFTPGPLVNATKIVLVQTVRVIKNEKPYFHEDGIIRTRSKFGVSIDQSSSSISPDYAADPSQEGSSLGQTPLENGAGAHGYRYEDSSGWHVEPAWLTDNPHLRGIKSFSLQVFETTAIAAEGHDIGRYYGSVKWGWICRTGTYMELIPLQVESLGSVTEFFREAAKQWNITTTKFDREPLKLPLPPEEKDSGKK